MFPAWPARLGRGAAQALAVLAVWFVGTVSSFAQGTVDPGFDPNLNERIHCTAVQPDGKILIGGAFTSLGGAARNFVARLHPDGTLDTAFNPIVSAPVFCMAVQSDGRIVIGGGFSFVGGAARNHIARLNADGTLDADFDPDAGGNVVTMAVQPDGRIVIGGGFSFIGGIARNGLARLNADGTLDPGFDANANQGISTIALQPDAMIVIGGGFTSVGGVPRNHIARLHADGTLDATFNPDADNIVWSAAVQRDGKIVIGGYFVSVGGVARNFMARLNADGSVDTGFDPSPNAPVFQMPLQADGKIVFGGYFTSVGATPRNHIARLNADGTLDPAFDPNVDGDLWSAMLQADGMIVVGGTFNVVGGVTRNHIARLLNDAATEALTIANQTRIEWLRDGASPETNHVTFELSTDGTTWTMLGAGTRIAGGWALSGLSLPELGAIRARARIIGGDLNGSSGIVQSLGVYDFGDTTPPSLTPPPSQVANATSPAGAVVNYPPATATDAGGPVTITYSKTSGTMFPIGTTRVTVTATDRSGNQSTSSFKVTVKSALEQTEDLIDYVTGLRISLATKIALTVRLAVVKIALRLHQTQVADRALREFIDEVGDQRPKLTTAQADRMIADATRIRNVID